MEFSGSVKAVEPSAKYRPALLPSATLLEPVLTETKALEPRALLFEPVVRAASAFCPTPVLLEACVPVPERAKLPALTPAKKLAPVVPVA